MNSGFNLNNLTKHPLPTITFVALAWVMLYKLNTIAFSRLSVTNFISWIFVPAGLRLLAVLLFNRTAAIAGLFIGALITGFSLQVELIDWIIISTISATSPYLAIEVANYFLPINCKVCELSLGQILTMCLSLAIYNAVLHNVYFYLFQFTHQFWLNTFEMFTGDFIGAFVVVYIFSATVKHLKLNKA